MSNTKNAGEKDEGHASAISVVLTTLKTTPVSTSLEDGIRFQTSPLSLVRGGGGGTEKHQNICCNRSFPSLNNYLLHLAEKAPKDVVHEMTLIEMGMLRCSVCSTWVHRDSMPLHLKKSHGVVKVTKNAKVVSPLSKHPASKNNTSETPLKTGKSYVIKVSGKTLPSGKSFVVSCPSSKLENSINVAATSVTSKPPMKLITTTSGSLYPKIHLQRGNNVPAGKVMVRQSLPNTSLPVVTLGSRVIMKSSMKVSGVKNGVPVTNSAIQKLVPVTNTNVLQEGGKTVNGVTTLQIDGSTVMASSSSCNFVNVGSTSTNSKEKQKLKLNQKSVSKGNKVVAKIENNKLKSTKKDSVIVSRSNKDLVSSKDFQCGTSTHMNVELDSGAKESSDVKNKLTFNKMSASSAKFTALRLTFSEDTTENLNENYVGKTGEALAKRSNFHRGKVKQKSKGSGTDGKVRVMCKTSVTDGNKVKTENRKDLPIREHYLGSSVSKDKHLPCVNSSPVLSDEKGDPRRETEGIKVATGKKQRKQILKPVLELEGDPNMNVPITSKVKVRKRKKKELLSDGPDTATFAKKNLSNPMTNQKKCGKSLKENKGDMFRPNPKISHASNRGGRGGWKKRGPGRPRKDELVKPASPDLSELDSLFGDAYNEDIENEPYMVSQVREDDNIPTVELDLFTLPSLNEQTSVLLTDPHNPDFKVYASMDAIFVGDSALGDVTNQIGYVTDANNVVFVNPGHFLFPNIQELDKFVPSPILTMKEKIGHSPKKLCKLSSSINHTKVICMDKRLMNSSDEGNRNKCSKRKALLGNHESQEKEKKQSKAHSGDYSTKRTVVKTPEESRVRRRSARFSGDQDEALQMPLKLKKGDLVCKDKRTSKGALGNELASKKLPLKLKIHSASLGKEKRTSVSLNNELYSMGSGGKELKVMLSPLKLEHQSLLEQFLLENKKSHLKSRISLTFSDDTVNKCQKARKKLGAQFVSNDILKCDIPATSAVCEKETVSSKRQRTRTRSADSVYSVKSAGIDPVASGKCNDNNYLSRRKGRLKSESEVLTNSKESKISNSARDQRQSKQDCEDAGSLLKTRLRHYSNVRELPKTTKTSNNLLCNNSDSSDNKHISHEEHNSSEENTEHSPICKVIAEETPECDVKESFETLLENSLIKGKNWNVTNNTSKSMYRTRPARERRPSSKWLESLAYGMQFRKVPSPMLRTTRSISDTTDQISCENLENELGVDENDVLSTTELNQSQMDCKCEGSQESAKGESDTKETGSSISNKGEVQQGAGENYSDEEKENIAGKNQSMDSEVMSNPSPKKQKDVDKIADCKIPSDTCEESPNVSCESTDRVPVEHKGKCRAAKLDNKALLSAKQTATEVILESNLAKSGNEILNVDSGGESIKSSNGKDSLSFPCTEFKANKVFVNTKKRGLKSKKTKLILKKVEDNFDDILNKTGSVSEDSVESLLNNRTQTMSSNLFVDAKTPDVSSMNLQIVNSGLKQDGIKSENIKALGINHVNIHETTEGDDNKLEAVDGQLDEDKNEEKDDHKTVSKLSQIKLLDCEGRRTKADLSENINDTVSNTILLKMVEDKNELEEDSSDKLQIVEEVDDQKLTKTISNEMPSETVKSEWSGLLDTSDGCHTKKLSEASVEASQRKVKCTNIRKLGESGVNSKNVKACREALTDSQSMDVVVLSELKAGCDTLKMNNETIYNPSILDTATENTAVKLGEESSPVKGSISRVSALLIEVTESVKAEEKVKSPQKVEGPRSPKKSSSSPTKGCLDISPPREWLGRGAKLKAQVLIQDQQTGVTDSHIVASSHTYSPDKGKSSSPKSEKLVVSTSDTSVNSKASGGSSKNVKSPKSPRICYEEREWQARGAKLKAQVMITDQQTGHTNTRVETFESVQSPRSSLTSPPSKKMKFESPPGSMKDIRSFFTLYKSPERGTTKSENKSEILSLPSSSGLLSPSRSNSLIKADVPSISSLNKCSPKSISSSPKPSPQSSKRKKVKLYTVTSSDIRNFFTPASGTKRKVELDTVTDISKSVKMEEDVFPAIKPEMEDDTGYQSSQETYKTSRSPDSSQENFRINKPVGVWNIHPLQEMCSKTPDVKDICPLQENCKVEITSDACMSVPEVPSVALDFEGFKLSSRSSDLRVRSLVRIVSRLENKALYGLGNFPLPVDHLCDWNDDWLNINIFDKHS